MLSLLSDFINWSREPRENVQMNGLKLRGYWNKRKRSVDDVSREEC